MPAPAAAELDAPLADEAAILAARAPDMLVFRFRDGPSVLVLSFPSLRQQGQMLDRLAAFVEKAGLPRGRVLADAELDAAIRQASDTPETYYFGHDYRVADIARFFAVADRDGTGNSLKGGSFRGVQELIASPATTTRPGRLSGPGAWSIRSG